MIADFNFLTEEELYELVKEQHNSIILWGMGTTVDAVYNTLHYLGVDFDYWGTGSSSRHIHTDGKPIVTYDDMNMHTEDIVLIASFAYVPIYKRLKELGVKQVYGIRDTFKYPLVEMVSDRRYLDCYFSDTKEKAGDKILLELYGNIGDVIVRIGIVKAFIDKYGKDNVYLLFASYENAEIYKLITKNIFILSEDMLTNNADRRVVLEKICETSFSSSFVLCDTRIYAQRRVLNRYNSNIYNVIWTNCLPEQEYLAGLDIDTVERVLTGYEKEELTAWNKLCEISSFDFGYVCLPHRKYVAVSLGASKKSRQYPAEQFKKVCHYIITMGYDIALLGCGADDELIAQSLCGDEFIKSHLVNYASKLVLVESAYIISMAEFFVGTESGMWNISYALGIPSVVIYGGGDYGNFMHPDGTIRYVMVNEEDCFYCKWFCDKTNESGTAKCIYSISADMITDKIDELMDDALR